jgi:hypothetical protein
MQQHAVRSQHVPDSSYQALYGWGTTVFEYGQSKKTQLSYVNRSLNLEIILSPRLDFYRTLRREASASTEYSLSRLIDP